MTLGVIPARDGSKRIPQKNIKDFCGKPIIAYSIEAALSSGCFDHVVVSTDSDRIAAVAENYGAETPFRRPAALSDDFTGTTAVVEHAIQETSRIWNREYEYVCCIYATAPFLTDTVVRKGADALQKNPDIDYAVTVTTFPFPIQRALLADDDGRIVMREPQHLETRSQDLREAFHDAGQIYWGRADAFLNRRPFFGRNSVPIILPRFLVQDIDTQEDWIRAGRMYRAARSENA